MKKAETIKLYKTPFQLNGVIVGNFEPVDEKKMLLSGNQVKFKTIKLNGEISEVAFEPNFMLNRGFFEGTSDFYFDSEAIYSLNELTQDKIDILDKYVSEINKRYSVSLLAEAVKEEVNLLKLNYSDCNLNKEKCIFNSKVTGVPSEDNASKDLVYLALSSFQKAAFVFEKGGEGIEKWSYHNNESISKLSFSLFGLLNRDHFLLNIRDDLDRDKVRDLLITYIEPFCDAYISKDEKSLEAIKDLFINMSEELKINKDNALDKHKSPKLK